MRYAIGIDLGGTKLEGVLVSERGKIVRRERLLTEAEKGRKVVLHHILKIIQDLMRKDVVGIGMGIPGRFDKSGKIIFMPNIRCLIGFRLQEFLRKKTRLPVSIQNDSCCFALAEHLFGAGRNSTNMIGIVIGTGIGSGLILDDKMYLGSRGLAGEIGHVVLKPLHLGRVEIETDCSGKHMTRKYVQAGGTIVHPGPKKIYMSKEAVARQVIGESIDLLAREIAILVTALDLDLVVLGGGVSNLPIYDALNKRVNGYVYEPLRNRVKVVKNRLGDSAGVIGASMLAFQD